MTKDALLLALRRISTEDPEEGHREADALLLEYLHDPEVTAAFNALTKWYA